MATQRDLERINAAQSKLVEAARDELDELLRHVDLDDLDAVSRALTEAYPALARKFGKAGQVAASAWYSSLHPTGWRPSGVRVADEISMKAVRYALHRMYVAKDSKVGIAIVRGVLQKDIATAVRGSLFEFGVRDPKPPLFASVPVGKTCAFCTMLASRGYAYRKRRGDLGAFHADCDCKMVPSWGKRDRKLRGYNPERYEQMYAQARKKADEQKIAPTARNMTALMREMYPDELTDGRVGH